MLYALLLAALLVGGFAWSAWLLTREPAPPPKIVRPPLPTVSADDFELTRRWQ
jgi:hypothetical protein